MNVLVLVAGICDTKWPYGAKQPRILSPFDESALEVAFKLRDAAAGVDLSVTVIVLGQPGDEALVRAVCALRPDRLIALKMAPDAGWDAVRMAREFRRFIAQQNVAADVILIGRQFGDRDDGALPACLATVLDATFARMAQSMSIEGNCVTATRERAGAAERIACRLPAVVSITNDRSNRIRHALLKNVMMAKRAPVDWVPAGSAVGGMDNVLLQDCAASATPVRAQECRIVQGSVQERAHALAEYLNPWRQEA